MTSVLGSVDLASSQGLLKKSPKACLYDTFCRDCSIVSILFQNSTWRRSKTYDIKFSLVHNKLCNLGVLSHGDLLFKTQQVSCCCLVSEIAE